MSSNIIEFYFDFASPFAYLAAQKVEDLGERFDYDVIWKPMLVSAAFKETGGQPLTSVPLKGEYSIHDMQRMARYMKIPFKLPDPFPIMTTAAARVFYWMEASEHSQEHAATFAKNALKAYFAENRNIGDHEVLRQLVKDCGVDPDEAIAAINDEKFKNMLRTITEDAVSRGVFGSPFFFVNGEPFWGSDRIWMMKKWIEEGGW